jgi:acetyl esterase/lipase
MRIKLTPDRALRVEKARLNDVPALVLRPADREPVGIGSPSRQTDYSNLPPCYTFVGEGEPFYAETLAYVDALRNAGVKAEVDVYPTDIHAFDMLFPNLPVSRQAIAAFNRHFEQALQ